MAKSSSQHRLFRRRSWGNTVERRYLPPRLLSDHLIADYTPRAPAHCTSITSASPTPFCLCIVTAHYLLQSLRACRDLDATSEKATIPPPRFLYLYLPFDKS